MYVSSHLLCHQRNARMSVVCHKYGLADNNVIFAQIKPRLNVCLLTCTISIQKSSVCRASRRMAVSRHKI